MKKYILLLGFAMASVDCSASGVAAYGNAVAAFLQAGKGLMGLKAPVQEALKKAKEDLGVGGGAEKASEDLGCEDFFRFNPVLKDFVDQTSSEQLRVFADLEKKWHDALTLHRMEFVDLNERIKASHPNLLPALEAFSTKSDELGSTIAKISQHLVESPNYPYIFPFLSEFSVKIDRFRKVTAKLVEEAQGAAHFGVEQYEKILGQDSELQKQRLESLNALDELERKFDTLINDMKKNVDDYQKQCEHRLKMLGVKANLEREEALKNLNMLNSRLTEEVDKLNRQVSRRYRTSLAIVAGVGAICFVGGVASGLFHLPIGQAIGNKLTQFNAVAESAFAGTKSIFAKMPGIGRIFAPALVAVAGSSS